MATTFADWSNAVMTAMRDIGESRAPAVMIDARVAYDMGLAPTEAAYGLLALDRPLYGRLLGECRRRGILQ